MASVKCWMAGYMPCSVAFGMIWAGLEMSEFCRKEEPVVFEFLVGFVRLDEPRRLDVPRVVVVVVAIFASDSRQRYSTRGLLAQLGGRGVVRKREKTALTS